MTTSTRNGFDDLSLDRIGAIIDAAGKSEEQDFVKKTLEAMREVSAELEWTLLQEAHQLQLPTRLAILRETEPSLHQVR